MGCSMKNHLLTTILANQLDQVDSRFSPEELQDSVFQIAIRWCHTLDYHEKKSVARTIGGNKYAKTTMLLLDGLFKEIVDEYREYNS